LPYFFVRPHAPLSYKKERERGGKKAVGVGKRGGG